MADNYPLIARERVKDFFNDFRNDGVPELPIDEVYCVWFCKILKNWKALVSTTIPDALYYEITYNGDTGDTYIDVYSKSFNVAVAQPESEVVANQVAIDFEPTIACNEGVKPETD